MPTSALSKQLVEKDTLTSLCAFSPSIISLLPVSEQANVPICDVTKGSSTGEFIQITLHPVFHFDGPFKFLWMVQQSISSTRKLKHFCKRLQTEG